MKNLKLTKAGVVAGVLLGAVVVTGQAWGQTISNVRVTGNSITLNLVRTSPFTHANNVIWAVIRVNPESTCQNPSLSSLNNLGSSGFRFIFPFDGAGVVNYQNDDTATRQISFTNYYNPAVSSTSPEQGLTAQTDLMPNTRYCIGFARTGSGRTQISPNTANYMLVVTGPDLDLVGTAGATSVTLDWTHSNAAMTATRGELLLCRVTDSTTNAPCATNIAATGSLPNYYRMIHAINTDGASGASRIVVTGLMPESTYWGTLWSLRGTSGGLGTMGIAESHGGDRRFMFTTDEVRAPARISAPTAILGTPSHSQMLVTWGVPDDRGSAIESYKLQWVDTAGAIRGGSEDWTTNQITVLVANCGSNANVCRYRHMGLTQNRYYHYRVIATNDEGDSEESPVAARQTDYAPRVLSVGTVTHNSVVLMWTGGDSDVANCTGVATGGAACPGLTLNSVSGGVQLPAGGEVSTPQTVTGLSPGMTYYFQVIAGTGSRAVRSNVVTVMALGLVAMAGNDQTADEGDTVMLTGTATNHVTGDPVADTAFVWTQTGVPSGVTGVTLLERTEGRAASFTVPTSLMPGQGGSYVFTLTVTDGDGGTGMLTATDTVTVTVGMPNDDAPDVGDAITVSHSPGAAIGMEDGAVVVAASVAGQEANMVTLSVSASDVDSSLRYEWAQVDGAMSATLATGATMVSLMGATTGTVADGVTRVSFAVPEFVGEDGMATAFAGLANEDMPNDVAVYFRVRVSDATSGWGDVGTKTQVRFVTLVVRRVSGGGLEVIDNAILPNVLRNISRQVQGSIYRRIEERQREEGYWE